jgi:antitoxin component YwqK of YwqJK toxin-antitoxin module
MRFLVLLAALACFAAPAFSKPPKLEDSPDGGTVKTEYYDSGAQKLVIHADDDGHVVEVTRFRDNDTLEALEIFDPASGQLRAVTRYGEDGKRNVEEIYAEDGALQSVKEFSPESDLIAKLSIYSPEKQLKKEVRFKNGKPDVAKEFYIDGRLKAEHLYDSQGKELKYTEYYPSGEVDTSILYSEPGLESKKSFIPEEDAEQEEK